MKKLRTIFALMIMNEYLLILWIRSRVIVLKDLPYKVLKVVPFGIFATGLFTIMDQRKAN